MLLFGQMKGMPILITLLHTLCMYEYASITQKKINPSDRTENGIKNINTNKMLAMISIFVPCS